MASVNYNRSHYSIGDNLNTELFSQNYSGNITYVLPLSIRISSDFNWQINGRQGNLPGTTIAILNASLFKNIFRNNRGEIRLSGFDLLNRNKGLVRIREIIILKQVKVLLYNVIFVEFAI